MHAGSATEEIKERVGREGARTIPGRPEHGKLLNTCYVLGLKANEYGKAATVILRI